MEPAAHSRKQQASAVCGACVVQQALLVGATWRWRREGCALSLSLSVVYVCRQLHGSLIVRLGADNDDDVVRSDTANVQKKNKKIK